MFISRRIKYEEKHARLLVNFFFKTICHTSNKNFLAAFFASLFTVEIIASKSSAILLLTFRVSNLKRGKKNAAPGILVGFGSGKSGYFVWIR